MNTPSRFSVTEPLKQQPMKRVTRIRARAALDAVLLEVGAVGSLVLIGSLSAMGQVSAAFTNPSAITILDYATASPYPSQITVSNLVGPISKLTATMNGFTHTFPSDVGVLLVGPAGQGIVLMNDAGNNAHGAATNLTLTFDQSAANPPSRAVSTISKARIQTARGHCSSRISRPVIAA